MLAVQAAGQGQTEQTETLHNLTPFPVPAAAEAVGTRSREPTERTVVLAVAAAARSLLATSQTAELELPAKATTAERETPEPHRVLPSAVAEAPDHLSPALIADMRTLDSIDTQR